MSETPIFKFRLVAENTTEKGKADSANENALIAEALFKQRVESRSISAPPGSPSNGQIWIVPDASASPAPSGAWAGHEDELALYYNGWIFIAPINGPVFYVADEDLYVKYDDTASPPAWIVGGPDTFLGLSDTSASYSGQAGKAVVVNGGETGLEFGAASGAFSGAVVGKDAAQTISSGANTLISWPLDPDPIDTDNYHDPTSNNSRIVAAFTGKHELEVHLLTVARTVAFTWQMWVSKNRAGSTAFNVDFPALRVEGGRGSTGSSGQSIQASAIIDLVAGDYVEVLLFLALGGGTLDLRDTCRASIRFLG